MAATTPTTKPTAETIKEEGFWFLAEIEGKGYKYVQIDFNGSGDSGSVDEIYSFDGVRDHQINSATPIKDEDTNNLRERLEDWAYRVLDHTDVDWYNNDGGYGHIRFNVPDRTVEYEVYQRDMTSELAASAEFTYGKGEFTKEEPGE